MSRRAILPLLCLWMLFVVASSESLLAGDVFPAGAKRVLFLGDSITHAGHYVSILEAEFLLQKPEDLPELINLGLPSETVSGLSEPGHPFPRPNLHERLQRALDRIQPDVVVACYGMNDGIYHPFEEQRFLAYQTGINTLIAQVHASGGKVVLLTPPPFDPVPLRGKGKLGSMDEQEHGFRLIFEDYNDVLQRYAEWIRDQKDRVACVVDLYAPVMRQLGKARKEAPDFTFANDGVHLNRDGHRILANAILAADGITPSAFEDSVLELEDLVHQRQLLWHNAYLSAVGHQRPGMKEGLPLDEIPNAVQDLTRQINEAVERIRSERSKTEKVKSTSTQN